MTERSIELLEEDKDGYFLMVECSQIDWAGNANDTIWTMKDTEAFEKPWEKPLNLRK